MDVWEVVEILLVFFWICLFFWYFWLFFVCVFCLFEFLLVEEVFVVEEGGIVGDFFEVFWLFVMVCEVVEDIFVIEEGGMVDDVVGEVFVVVDEIFLIDVGGSVDGVVEIFWMVWRIVGMLMLNVWKEK